MFKRLVLGSTLFAAALFAGGGPVLQPMSYWESQHYYQMLQKELDKAYDRADETQKNCPSASIDPGNFIKQHCSVSEAEATAGTKQILFDQLYGDPVMDSPIVRSELLDIFRKEIITEKDLNGLKSVIKEAQKNLEEGR